MALASRADVSFRALLERVFPISNPFSRSRIDFSKDGGTKWTEIVGGFQGPKADGDTVKYNWTVPNSVTTTGQFRACQLAGGECVDPIYILKSGDFTITTTSGILSQGLAASAPSLQYDVITRSIETSFALAAAEKVSLQVLDARGQVVATLLDGRQDAGFHRMAVFSNQLEGVTGHFVLKLTLASRSFTQSWNVLR